MWILESEGDTFKGKKFWLRPGRKFLIGRTKVEGAKYAIEDKTVSKKHLTVEVGPIEPGDCQNVHKRSRVSVKDSSKIGTLLNDEQIRNSQRELQHEYNEIRLGRHKHLFKINWVPVTLTFSFAGKLAKTEFPKLYDTLGPLDIKVLNTYEQGQTTHVVAKTRNTSKGLQALIDGKFIVSQTFTDAIIKAAQPSSTPPAPIEEAEDGGPAPPLESESPLEEDFEGNFPNALDHLPPRGQEPIERPSEAYAPNSARKNMFEGYTYIFYEKGQFDSLLAPITQGGGKATLEPVVAHQTTVDGFVRRVKSVAGEKGLGEFEDGSVGKGVVVVRFIPRETEDPAKEEARTWYGTFYNRVALQLDHRLIEQNEFLDAILNNDASVLRKSLEVEETGTMAPPPSVATAMTSQTMRSSPPPRPTPARPVDASAEVEAAPVRRGRARRAVTSRFKGFEDDDFQSLPNNSAPPPVEVSQAPPPVESQSQSMFVSQDPQEMVVDSPPIETQTTRSRKRKTPPVAVEESEEEDIMEQMAPVAAARKRRRENDEATRRQRGESILPPPAPAKVQKPVAPVPKPKKQKPVEEIDVQGELARRREKEREIAEAETLALREQLDGMDIEQIRNLAIIEEVEVKRSEPRPRVHGEDSERWDDKWNGRKNFKKFRPKGQNVPRNLNRVIVQLEEVKKRDYGIGDEYWLDGDVGERPKKGKGKGKRKETPGVSQVQSQSSRPSSARSQAVEEEVIEDPVANDVSSSEDLPDDVPKFPKAKPSAAASRSSRQTSVASVASAPQERPPQNKRSAATTLTKPAPAKKARQTTLRKPESDKDSDSEDELKFRFRKKK